MLWFPDPDATRPPPDGIGGKARALAALPADVPVPAWCVLLPSAFDAAGALRPDARRALGDALRRLGGDAFAVRSSAAAEDGARASHAGQFLTRLDVPAADVAGAAEAVVASRTRAHVAVYHAALAGAAAGSATPGGDGANVLDAPTTPKMPEGGLASPLPPQSLRDSVPARTFGSPGGAVEAARHPDHRDAEAFGMAVIVQRMVAPRAAGVAFSADAATGQRRVALVAAVAGRGDALVDGTDTGQTLRLDAAGTVLSDDGPRVLSPDDAARVAALARRLEAHFGPAQDVEWALDGAGTLFALQSRPVTTLAALPDPDAALRLWDNANVSESYRGRVSPLTFSFARTAYAHVYRAWLGQMGVPTASLAAHADAFRRLIGYVEGRVYYHLPSWYRLLGLLPGIGANRGFMETMMGVREGLPPGVLPETAPLSGVRRLAETLRLARTGVRLAWTFATMERRSRQFLARVDRALDLPDLAPLPFDAVVAEYRVLEDTLLPAWGTPLANDVATMVAFGLTRRLAARWAPGTPGLAEALATPGEGVLSAAPAAAAAAIADAVRRHGGPALGETLVAAPPAEALAALRSVPDAAARFDATVARFGDRCFDELKLESPTLVDDPTPLVRTVGALAARPAPPPRVPGPSAAARMAEAGVRGPLRRGLLGALAAWARASVRRREALRFERTRVFGAGRRLFRTAGQRLAADGRLAHGDDVFWLDVADVLALADGTATTHDLRGLVALRRAEHARWAERPAPPERFLTHGPLGFGPFQATASAAPAAPFASDEHVRTGTGASPGRVEGTARVVHEPHGVALAPDEILVADRTDPGWVTLFAAASGLVVARGSLLSHAAIVARELGLPAVVGVADATAWLRTGDRIALDGTTGCVTRLSPAEHA